MKNFDTVVAIDWSGALMKAPGRAIAVAELSSGSAIVLPSPRWTRTMVMNWLAAKVEAGVRTFVGIDCNFGYSQQVGLKQFGRDYTAPDLWSAVDAANADRPDFFADGFWTHDDHAPYFWQNGKRPDDFEMPQRLTEITCAQSGLGHPESPFKLIGPKQVGKGGLAGMRMLHHLKTRFGDKVAIWPFDRETDAAVLVVAEIYPRLFLKMAGHGAGKVRTAEELSAVLRWLDPGIPADFKDFSDHDADAVVSAAGLRRLCGKGTKVPERLSHPPAPPDILAREGWIFGVGA